jgi:putative ABC transport system permease protein
MLTWEILRLAFSSLKANKLRSGLTLLGIAVGVFSVIGVMTLINGLRTSVENGLNVLGANSFQVSKWPAVSFSPSDWMRYRNRRDVTYADAARFKELMGESAHVNLQLGRGGRVVVYKERRTNPNVGLRGTDENFITAFNFEVAAGRNLGPDDVEYARPVCLLGNDVVEKLFPNEEAVGATIRIEGQNYTVVGVLAAKGTSFGGSQDNFVATPLTRWLTVYGRQHRSISINVQAPSQLALPDTQDKAIGTMRLVRGLAPEDLNDFEIFSNESLIEAFNKIADIVAVGALIISAIALLASGVGVMNIMLVSVTERTKEIGIRKSIGAKKRSIMLQFLAEAVALSLFGGLAGVAIGVGGGNVVASLMHATITFPWLWAGIGMFVCGGIGVVFGAYPAWKAASLDPIEALRYE